MFLTTDWLVDAVVTEKLLRTSEEVPSQVPVEEFHVHCLVPTTWTSPLFGLSGKSIAAIFLPF